MSGKLANDINGPKRRSAKFEQIGELELNAVSAGGSFRNSQGGAPRNSQIEVEKEVDRTSVPLVQA